MSLRKLITMTEFVNQTLSYTNESHNYERGIELINWYSNLIQQPITINMFTDANPLFPNFKIVDGVIDAVNNKYKNSVWLFGRNEFAVTLLRDSHSVSKKKGMGFRTSYHIRTIEQMAGMDVDFNMLSDYAESDLFD